MNILAINPGTRYIGLAVFQGPDLTYWGVKVMKGKWSSGKLVIAKTTFLNLVQRHNITMLILKNLDRSRSSRKLSILARSITALAKKKRLKFRLYYWRDIKKFFARGRRINKMDIAVLIANRYKFLSYVLERERKNKHPYSTRMFEAIAAGVLILNHSNR